MVKVKALQRVYYAGHEYAPGETLEVTDQDATRLAVIRKVIRAEDDAQAPRKEKPALEHEPEPEGDETDNHRKGGRHKRRDMRAED
jgi:hypothetical protein